MIRTSDGWLTSHGRKLPDRWQDCSYQPELLYIQLQVEKREHQLNRSKNHYNQVSSKNHRDKQESKNGSWKWKKKNWGWHCSWRNHRNSRREGRHMGDYDYPSNLDTTENSHRLAVKTDLSDTDKYKVETTAIQRIISHWRHIFWDLESVKIRYENTSCKTEKKKVVPWALSQLLGSKIRWPLNTPKQKRYPS